MTAFIDGAARGNPGPAGAGAYFPSADGRPALELFESLGRATNNEAEYRALLLALRAAQERGASDLTIFADSLLLVEQLNGRFRLKAANLRPLFNEALLRAKSFRSFSISHVRRESNKDADRLANRGADGSEAPALERR
jgi:ribonuclease HI